MALAPSFKDRFTLVLGVLQNRYFSFLCGLALMTAAGTEYMFSSYSTDLKELLAYDQTQINFVGTCTNLGIYLGFYMGIVYDFTNARFTCLLGAGLLFVGWFFAYLATIGTISSNYILMGFFMFLQGNGSNAIYTAALANNLVKFHPRTRGTVVGFLVSMFGLSSAIFSPIYVYVFDSNVQNFFLFFAILLPVVAASGILFLAPVKVSFEKTLEEEEEIEGDSSVIVKEEISTLKMFSRIDFWIMFTLFSLGAGVGLTVINNLGSMVDSVDGASGSSFVTFLSIFNFLGRIVAGIVSDISLKFNLLSRISVLGLFMAVLGVGQLYFAYVLSLDNSGWMYPGVAITGICYGALMSLSPSITTELFGKSYFGGNWSIIKTSVCVSSFVMATFIAGRLYENNVDVGTDCYGWSCYGYTMLINFGVCVLTIILCSILSFRWFLYIKKRNAKAGGLLTNLISDDNSKINP